MKFVLDANIAIKFYFAGALSRAIELSSQARIGVFDCLYIALAEREQCQVVTADQRMFTLFPTEAISLASL
jgi:predicted nucleic acid-binding protein